MNEYDGGFGSWYFQNMDSFTDMQLQQAKTQASAKGDSKWLKVLDYVFKYGDQALTTLSKNGIIPNKNIQSVLKGSYDQQALAQLLAANGGSLDKNPNQITDRSAKIFGLDTSTLILIAAAILIFFVMQNGKK